MLQALKQFTEVITMENQYKQLTLEERYQIQAYIKLDFSARKISQLLERSNKSISRELSRCQRLKYNAQSAHLDSINKRKRAAKRSKHGAVKDIVHSLLKLDLSPEQIAGRMKLEGLSISLSFTGIYNLTKRYRWLNLLARKGKPYKPRKGIEAGAKLIPNRVDIDERPEIVDVKEEVGHWEGDTVYGQDSYLVTLTERVTKALLTCRVKNKSKKLVTRALIKMLKPFKKLCKTVTFDNGGEFAGHEKLAKAIDCKVYFAKPYHSWQRGLNENTNGLLRRYFPKGMAIAALSTKVIKDAAFLINMRPRKGLNYRSPIEVLTGKSVSLIAVI